MVVLKTVFQLHPAYCLSIFMLINKLIQTVDKFNSIVVPLKYYNIYLIFNQHDLIVS